MAYTFVYTQILSLSLTPLLHKSPFSFNTSFYRFHTHTHTPITLDTKCTHCTLTLSLILLIALSLLQTRVSFFYFPHFPFCSIFCLPSLPHFSMMMKITSFLFLDTNCEKERERERKRERERERERVREREREKE